jgi:hypothetical protein
MKASQEIRFERLFPKGLWKSEEYGDEGGQVQVGLRKKSSIAPDLLMFLDTIWPEGT